MVLPIVIYGKGRIMGKDHAHAGKDCQDGCYIKEIVVAGKTYIVGVVSDGSSGAQFSQVAGLLLPEYVVNQVERLLSYNIPFAQVPVSLYPNVITFLDQLARSVMTRTATDFVQFIADFTLATIVGFIVGEEEGCIFYAGDGLYQINDAVTVIDFENKSPYPGYHLVPESARKGGEKLPTSFTVVPIDVASLGRLAVTTDGFSETLLRRMWIERREGSNIGIQLWMQFINGPRNPIKEDVFADDGAVVAIMRTGG
jgi:hypothetical protein